MHPRTKLLLLSSLLLSCCQEEADLSNKGRILLQDGQYQKAAGLYKEMPAQKSSAIAKFHGQNISLAHLGELKTPPDTLPKGASPQQQAHYYYDLGNYFIIKGAAAEAINFYQKALYLQPGLPEAAHNLQLALLMPAMADIGGQKQDKQQNSPDNAPQKKSKKAQENGPEPTKSNRQQQADAPQGRPGTLRERLEELLNGQRVMIMVPETRQRESGSSGGPSW